MARPLGDDLPFLPKQSQMLCGSRFAARNVLRRGRPEMYNGVLLNPKDMMCQEFRTERPLCIANGRFAQVVPGITGRPATHNGRQQQGTRKAVDCALSRQSL